MDSIVCNICDKAIKKGEKVARVKHGRASNDNGTIKVSEKYIDYYHMDCYEKRFTTIHIKRGTPDVECEICEEDVVEGNKAVEINTGWLIYNEDNAIEVEDLNILDFYHEDCYERWMDRESIEQ